MPSDQITPQQLRLFAGLLAMPSEESLVAIEEIAQQNHWLYESLPQLKSISLEHWQTEHTKLFINGHPETPCPPFESVYRHGIMSGQACCEIEQLYQSIGLEPVEDMPADYLGVMLECAAYLLEQKSSATDLQSNSGEIKKGANFQTLWQDHLAKWLPKFASDLQQHSQLHLYQQLGRQLKELF